MTSVLVGIFALIITLLNSVGFFIGILNRPANTIYLGTIHYFEDYFLYVNHFFQGAHGAFLTTNSYTNETTPVSIYYWTNVLMGKLGGLIGLSPIASYHVSVLLLTITTIVALYLLLNSLFPKNKYHALLGFIIAVLSTSFLNHIVVNGNPMWYPFQLWKTPHFAFDRFGGVPHQILQSLLFYILTMLCFTNKASSRLKTLFFISVVSFSLTSINPIQAILFLAAFLATQAILYFQKKPIPVFKLLILFIVIVSTFIYMYFLSSTLPHAQARAWEGLQHTTTTLPFLLLSLGPISIFLILGILPSFLSSNTLFIFSVILVLGTYGTFLTNIPQSIGVSNLRIIFPALYPFMAAIAVNGMRTISKKLAKIIPTTIAINIMMVLFVLFSLPTLFWEIQQKVQSQSDKTNQTLYLHIPIYDMFRELETIGQLNDVVLANPNTHMDTIVPALSGHSTYSGHMLLTIRSEEKKFFAQQFFALNKKDALQWLKENNIRYILFTPLDGDINIFTQTYPFLKIYKMFKTSAAILAV